MLVLDRIVSFFKKKPCEDVITPTENTGMVLGVRATTDDTSVTAEMSDTYKQYVYRHKTRELKEFIIENVTRNRNSGVVMYNILHIPTGLRIHISPKVFGVIFTPQGAEE